MKKKREEKRRREEEVLKMAYLLLDESFAQFLDVYPAAKRKGGTHAKAIFRKALGKETLETMLAALEQHKRSTQWQNPRFVPAMVTWLEEERWIQILPEPERKLTPWETARKLGYK